MGRLSPTTWGTNSPETIAFTNYVGVLGTNQFNFDGMIYVNSQTRYRGQLSTSNTLLVGEHPNGSPNGEYSGWWFSDFGYDPHFGAPGIVLGVNEEQPTDLSHWTRLREPMVSSTQQNRRRAPGSTTTVEYDYCSERHENGRPDYHCFYKFWSYHPGGANFLYVDGRVDMISYEIGREKINEMAKRKKTFPLDWE